MLELSVFDFSIQNNQQEGTLYIKCDPQRLHVKKSMLWISKEHIYDL